MTEPQTSVNPAKTIRQKPLRLRVHGWLRWLHIYTSMLSLFAVLFFSLTGITLNHPEWVFGNSATTKELKGTLPTNWKKNGKIDWLSVVEYLRANQNLHGMAGDYNETSTDASFSFKAPAYSADVYITPQTGAYTVNLSTQGFVGVMNDLHRGRDSGKTWAWFIDMAAWFLVFVSATGLGLLFYLKKFRATALWTTLAGALLLIVLMRMTT